MEENSFQQVLSRLFVEESAASQSTFFEAMQAAENSLVALKALFQRRFPLYVELERYRGSTLGDTDTLMMYRVDYMSHAGWHQYDPGYMESFIRYDVAEKMCCKIVPMPEGDVFLIRGVAPNLTKVVLD